MERQLFCEGWLFGEKGEKKVSISLPHDAMQIQGRRPDAPSGSGGAFFQGGEYEYEKKFWVPENWRKKDVFLEFEGIYPQAKICLNGKTAGECRYGYSLFQVPLKGLLYNEYNDLCIEVDNKDLPNSRWYSGAGIYRPVWLLTGEKEHIEIDGIRIKTLSSDPARIRVDVKHTKKDCKDKDVLIEIFYDGKKITEKEGEHAEIDIPDAKLWSDETPDLYQCVVTLKNENKIVDVENRKFGIRTIEWSTNGLKINGRNTLLRGGCIHHDNGILGARNYETSEWRRIKRLKEYGFNAIRASHNPASRITLEACDSLGVYVLDETWDMWNKSKTKYDYGTRFMENYENDLVSLVAKDYNHPSVIMYSIGNEITEPATSEGVELAGEIVKKIKNLDPDRPVTAGINLTLLLLAMMEQNPLGSEEAIPDTSDMNSTVYNQMVLEWGNSMTMAAATEAADKVSSPVFDTLDIAGYNYAVSRYEKESEVHPERIIVGSETYVYDLAKNWPLVEKYPYVIGDFMWTAWDYLGEAGIGGWSYDSDDKVTQRKYPWLLADTGAIDLLGNETAEAGMAAVVWGKRKIPYIGVCPVNHPGVIPTKAIWRGSNALPYWSYSGCEGNPADIEVYGCGHEVELFLNGRPVGRKMFKDCRADFQTTYESGELKAVMYDEDGNFLSESRLRSAEGRTKIRVEKEENIKGNLIYLDISLVGENGEIECNKDTLLKVSVENGELLGFGSANPKTEENFLTGEYHTYYGRSQAVIKVYGEQTVVKVEGEGMEMVSELITV